MRHKNLIRRLVISALMLFFAGVGATNAWAQSGGFVYVGHCNTASDPEIACTNDVWALAIDGTSGALTPVTGSPFTAGTDPQRLTVDPTGQFVYVPNLRDANVSAFKITAGSGALTPVSGSPFSAGVFPTGVTTDPAGQFLYVSNQGGSISAYMIDGGSGALTPVEGSPFPGQTGAAWLAVDPLGRFLYVANCGTLGCGSGAGGVSGYTINSGTGALTLIAGSPIPTGMIPIGVAINPAGKFVYVVNHGSDSISAFAINQDTGALTPIEGSPFPTGMGPAQMAIDPTGQFAYVSNCGNTGNCHVIRPGSVSAYSIDSATGALGPVTGSPFAAEMGSVFVAIDPSGQFVYVSNAHSGNISAFAIDAVSGVLTQIPGSPFAAGGGPIGLATTAGPPAP